MEVDVVGDIAYLVNCLVGLEGFYVSSIIFFQNIADNNKFFFFSVFTEALDVVRVQEIIDGSLKNLESSN